MALDSDAIQVAGTGRVYVAPVGSTGPADIATALDAAWKDLGYISDDGVSISPGADSNEISTWQDPYPVRRVITARTLEVSFTLLEWNENTLPFALGGGSITTTTGPPIHYLYNLPSGGTVDERALLVEWTDGTKITRFTVSRGAVTDVGDMSIVRGEAAGLEVTYTGFSSSTGTTAYFRTNAPSFAAG
jgi:hypothetical protein